MISLLRSKIQFYGYTTSFSKRLYSTLPASGSLDGVDPKSPLITKRAETIRKLDKELLKHRGVIVTAPPFTGKTSLASLYEQYCRSKGRQVVKISMSGIPSLPELPHRSGVLPEDTSFDTYWKRETSAPWAENFYLSREDRVPTYIIIDDAQKIYGRAEPFWSVVKKNFDLSRPNPVRVLAFADYEERSTNTPMPTSPTFNRVLTLEEILLTSKELDQLVAKTSKIPVSTNIKEKIERSSAGHVGLAVITLALIRDMILNSKTPPDDPDIYAYLLSREFTRAINLTPAIPSSQIWVPIAERLILKSVLDAGDGKISFGRRPDEDCGINNLVRKGYLATTDGGLKAGFASPLIEAVFMFRILHSSSAPWLECS